MDFDKAAYDRWVTREPDDDSQQPCGYCTHPLEEHSEDNPFPCEVDCDCEGFDFELPEPDWDAINDDKKLGLI